MAAASASPDPTEVFFSYAYEDEQLMKELVSRLSIFKRHGFIRGWCDRNIAAGTEPGRVRQAE